MEFAGSMTFTDDTNHLICEIQFNPESCGFFKSIFTKAKQPADYFRGEIIRTTALKKTDKDVACTIDGSWLSHLDVNNVRLWSIDMVPSGVIPEVNPLPSDCRFREDLIALLNKDFEHGKEYKNMLEERQRYEADLRKAGRPKRRRKDRSG